MKSLIKNFFQKKPLKVPQSVVTGFSRVFDHSVNVEWSKAGKVFEALFYDNEIEKIARFDKLGNLIEIRTNISPTSLPEPAKTIAASRGEIMNAILINRGNNIFYEVIVRKNPVIRILLLLNDKAQILSKKVL